MEGELLGEKNEEILGVFSDFLVFLDLVDFGVDSSFTLSSITAILSPEKSQSRCKDKSRQSSKSQYRMIRLPSKPTE